MKLLKKFAIAWEIGCGIWLVCLAVWIIRDPGPVKAADKAPYVAAESFLALVCFVLAAVDWAKL
jgi:hypothetical protein